MYEETQMLDTEKSLTPAPRRSQERAQPCVERAPDGQLWVVREGRRIPSRVRPCFPWSQPSRYVSLRDFDDEEVGFVRDVSDLDADSRKALEHALIEAGFVLEVESIASIVEEVEIRSWRVQTLQGPRSFQTARDEWPRELPGGSLLIRDVAGDLFFVREPSALDQESQDLLWAFAD
jgi:hypothetical protein